MPETIIKVVIGLMFAILFPLAFSAQTSRSSVPASEVNGTFHQKFTGKFRGTASEIKILALGKNRLKIAFDLVYPFIDGTGGLMANVGQAEGEAVIEGDTAVYETRDEFGECRITIKFVRPGVIDVSQEGNCGFGHNVSADGRFMRISKRKPKF